MPDPRFKYEDYERTVFITREELQVLIQGMLATKPTWKDIIFITAKTAVITWAMAIRKNMHEEELQRGRQMYTLKREDDREGGRAKPDIDGRPRP